MSLLQTTEMHILLNSKRWQQNILKLKNWFFFPNVCFILVSFILLPMFMAFLRDTVFI